MRGIESEIEQFLRDGMEEVKREMSRAGEIAVQHNIEYGDYRNRTGNLRRSNYYRVDESGLIVGNSADYAGDVEARGYMVCSGGALLAEQILNNGNQESRKADD